MIFTLLRKEGINRIHFCDTKKTGFIEDTKILSYAEMENLHRENGMPILLASCSQMFEMANRALAREVIEKVYHVLPLLDHFRQNTPEAEDLYISYERQIKQERLFAIA